MTSSPYTKGTYTPATSQQMPYIGEYTATIAPSAMTSMPVQKSNLIRPTLAFLANPVRFLQRVPEERRVDSVAFVRYEAAKKKDSRREARKAACAGLFSERAL